MGVANCMGVPVRVVLVAALLALGFVSPQAAVSAEPALRVQADVSGYATVDFATPFRFDGGRWSLSGKGSYKVALLDRVVKDRAGAGYNLLFSDVPAMQAKPVVLGGPGGDAPVVVPAGRYRVHVVSDAPARLTIPLQGHGSRTLHIKKKSPVQVRLDRGTPGSSQLPPHKAVIRSDFTLSSVVTYKFSKWTLSTTPGPFTRTFRDCITTRTGQCGDTASDTGVSTGVGDKTQSRQEYWDTFDYTFKGQASAVTEYSGTDRPKSFAQFLVAFPVA